ncbi:hypothetical protein [Streptosporangium lutulentum]|uniref:Alpha-glucoside transport system substrate-binding protein n=1 Tax=Streptosporangium lutulentum TaxID=1461250 RepID=A0ABT9Q609_9ACTN|nr:hypothetical protein [Streptosporangium lutulentum]MDP9842158.1 alpha-glucoside transport system substrate-binding protein [Streptosporangium lutulentum]
MNRRQALTVLSGLAAAGLSGCDEEGPLRIAVVWSGWELNRFRDILKWYDRPTVVYSAGDNIAALLKNPVASASTPDVAIVPRLELVEDDDIRARLKPLTSFDPLPWKNLVRQEQEPDTSLKGIWFKVAHKSRVWHRPGTAPALPTDWAEWVKECRIRAGRTGPRPLSIGAADGWVLTDWFENVLLGVDAELYGRLHLPPPDGWRPGDGWGHESVKETLTRLAELWSIPGLLPGGGRRALITQFHDSILDVFRYGHADMVAAPDFAWPVIKGYRTEEQEREQVMSFRFPWPAGGEKPPVLVGGDVVVALTAAGDRGKRFAEWLTGPDVARNRLKDWIEAGGFLSLNESAPLSHTALDELTTELRGDIAFDLSDRLTGGLAGGDGRGLWRVLTEFFTVVAAGGRPPRPEQLKRAVDDAMGMLTALSGTGRTS